MEQQIRFCTSADGTGIAYATAGVGFHGLDSAAEIAGFSALAGAMVVVGLLILWVPWKERHV